MMRTFRVPLRESNFRPAFWGVDRDFKDVLDNIESVWNGSPVMATSLGNFKETDSAYLMTIEMPGVNKKDLEIQIEGDQLLVNAKKKSAFSADEKDAQKVSRTIQIPKMVDREKIQAHCEDGVLYLALPKEEKAQPRKIEISEGGKSTMWENLLGHTHEKNKDTATET